MNLKFTGHGIFKQEIYGIQNTETPPPSLTGLYCCVQHKIHTLILLQLDLQEHGGLGVCASGYSANFFFPPAVGSMKLFFLFSQGNLDNLHKYTKLSLLISAFFLCVRFTCPKSKNIFIKSNVPVTKLKLEKVIFVMFCNVAKPDFYFPNLQMR